MLIYREYGRMLFMKKDYEGIITIEPGKRGGKPVIRGMRITVGDVLEMLASGMSEKEILGDFEMLTKKDIRAVLAYAADREGVMVIAPHAPPLRQ